MEKKGLESLFIFISNAVVSMVTLNKKENKGEMGEEMRVVVRIDLKIAPVIARFVTVIAVIELMTRRSGQKRIV